MARMWSNRTNSHIGHGGPRNARSVGHFPRDLSRRLCSPVRAGPTTPKKIYRPNPLASPDVGPVVAMALREAVAVQTLAGGPPVKLLDPFRASPITPRQKNACLGTFQARVQIDFSSATEIFALGRSLTGFGVGTFGGIACCHVVR
jgi:hypothetical protein